MSELIPVTYIEPVKIMSTKEIAALPYSEMHKQIADQEKHVITERGIGYSAYQALRSIRQGGGIDYEKD